MELDPKKVRELDLHSKKLSSIEGVDKVSSLVVIE